VDDSYEIIENEQLISPMGEPFEDISNEEQEFNSTTPESTQRKLSESTGSLKHSTLSRPAIKSRRAPTKNAFKQGESYSTKFTSEEVAEIKSNQPEPVLEEEPAPTSTKKFKPPQGAAGLLAQMGAPDLSKLKKSKKVTEEKPKSEEEQPKSEETTENEQPLLSLDDEPAPTKKFKPPQGAAGLLAQMGTPDLSKLKKTQQTSDE